MGIANGETARDRVGDPLRRLFCIAVLLAGAATPIRGQDSASLLSDQIEELTAGSKSFTFDEHGRLTGGIALGNVRLRTRNATFEADGIGFFIPTGEAEPELAANPLFRVQFRVVAVGNVTLRVRDEQFLAESVFYDSSTEYAVLTHARLICEWETLRKPKNAIENLFREGEAAARSTGEIVAVPRRVPEVFGLGNKLYFSAERIEIQGQDRFEVLGLCATTCSMADPHWGVDASRGTIEAQGRSPEAESRPTHYRLRAEDLSLRGGWLPRVPLTSTSVDSRLGDWLRLIPLRGSPKYSNSSNFGNRILLPLNGNAFLPDAIGKNINLDLDVEYLSLRGMGYGGEWEYAFGDPGREFPRRATPTSFGTGAFYYISDRGTDADGFVPEERDRYRGRWHHRSESKNYGTIFDLEFAKQSDENFLNEYFEEELRRQKRPENFAYLRQPTSSNSQLTLLGKLEWDDFQTHTERLPELGGFLVEQPLGASGADLDATMRLSNLRLEPADDLPLRERQIGRADVETIVAYPLGNSTWGKLRPFFETRYTAWDEQRNSTNSIDRVALATGGLAGWHFGRTFDVAQPDSRFEALRHTIDPEIGYRLLFENDVDPNRLVFFDEAETVARREVLTLATRSYLFARQRPAPPAANADPAAPEPVGESRRLVEGRVAIDYFPDANRDNLTDEWGPLVCELQLYTFRRFEFFAEGEFDVRGEDELETGSAGIRYLPALGGMISVEDVYTRNTSHSIVGNVAARLSDRYELLSYYEYDLTRHKAANQSYSVVRNFHCWSLLLKLEIDEGEDDNVTFKLEFAPRELLRRKQISSETTDRW